MSHRFLYENAPIFFEAPYRDVRTSCERKGKRIKITVLFHRRHYSSRLRYVRTHREIRAYTYFSGNDRKDVDEHRVLNIPDRHYRRVSVAINREYYSLLGANGPRSRRISRAVPDRTWFSDEHVSPHQSRSCDGLSVMAVFFSYSPSLDVSITHY